MWLLAPFVPFAIVGILVFFEKRRRRRADDAEQARRFAAAGLTRGPGERIAYPWPPARCCLRCGDPLAANRIADEARLWAEKACDEVDRSAKRWAQREPYNGIQPPQPWPEPPPAKPVHAQYPRGKNGRYLPRGTVIR